MKNIKIIYASMLCIVGSNALAVLSPAEKQRAHILNFRIHELAQRIETRPTNNKIFMNAREEKDLEVMAKEMNALSKKDSSLTDQAFQVTKFLKAIQKNTQQAKTKATQPKEELKLIEWKTDNEQEQPQQDEQGQENKQVVEKVKPINVPDPQQKLAQAFQNEFASKTFNDIANKNFLQKILFLEHQNYGDPEARLVLWLNEVHALAQQYNINDKTRDEHILSALENLQYPNNATPSIKAAVDKSIKLYNKL
jgi:hypothetical protein